MSIWMKYFILFLIMTALKWIFSIAYHFSVKGIAETRSEDSAIQLYSFLKILSFILIVAFFSIIIVSKFLDFANMTGFEKIGTCLFWIYLLAYYKSSMGMANHLLNLKFFPNLITSRLYEASFGDIKEEENEWYFIHDDSRTKINLTKLSI